MHNLTVDLTDQSWQELQALLDTRINEGLQGKVSDMRVENILDEELSEGRCS